MHLDTESIAERSSTALLRCIPLFAGLPEHQLEQIARMAKLRKVSRNTAIVHVGDEIDALYVIVSGSAKVLNRDSEGREVILSLLGAGECVGEMGLIDGSPRSADVVAIEPRYRIHRDCGIVVTRHGAGKPQARAFAEFLESPAARAIFAEHGWITR